MTLRTRPHSGFQRRRQHGAVLVVGLIMLVLVTLIAVAAARMATTHLQVVGNEQFRAQASAAANYALDMVVNDKNFVNETLSANPVTVDVLSSDPAASGIPIGVSYTDPNCLRYRYIKKSELVTQVGTGTSAVYTVKPSDVACFSGQPSTGITIVSPAAANNNDNSLCVTTLWDVNATANDPQTGAQVSVTQGIEMRMDANTAETKCKP